MKKRLILTITLVVCSFCLMPTAVYALEGELDGQSHLDIEAKASYLMEYQTGEVLHEQNATDARPIASMVKIMTLLCVYDEINNGSLSLDDDVCVSERAASMGGSQVFLDANTVHKAKDLISSIIICSANDSCVALAEHISGSVEGFVDKMNKKATELCLVNTHFENCTGLPTPSQHSCAADVAKMLSHLIKNKDFFNHSTIWMLDYKHPDGRITGMTNTNRLSKFYKGCDGGKTGFTSEALHCLAATAERNNTRYIAVVIGADSSQKRFDGIRDMFDYAFANFQCEIYAHCDKEMGQSAINGAKQDYIPFTVRENLVFFGKKGRTTAEINYELFDNIKAPVSKGDCLGRASLICDGKVIAQTDIIAYENAESKSYFDCIDDIVDNW